MRVHSWMHVHTTWAIYIWLTYKTFALPRTFRRTDCTSMPVFICDNMFANTHYTLHWLAWWAHLRGLHQLQLHYSRPPTCRPLGRRRFGCCRRKRWCPTLPEERYADSNNQKEVFIHVKAIAHSRGPACDQNMQLIHKLPARFIFVRILLITPKAGMSAV